MGPLVTKQLSDYSFTARTAVRSNEARRPTVAVKSSNDVPMERLQAQIAKCCNP